MFVYNFDDEQPVTPPHSSSQIGSIEPLTSNAENADENLNESNAVVHVSTVEPTLLNVQNRGAVEAMDVEYELEFDS